MKYKVGDLIAYKYDTKKEFLGIVTKTWKDAFTNMYLVYFFDQKTTNVCYESALCHLSIK